MSNPGGFQFSRLSFLMDDVMQFEIGSGFGQTPPAGWQQRSFNIPAGSHVLRWNLYTRAGPGATGSTVGLDEIVVQSLSDSDSDGMDDDWERLHFGDLSQDASGDFDGDGSSNGNEFAAMTDPTNPTDHFRITSISPNSDTTSRLTWTSVPGLRYQVQVGDDLGAWRDVGGGVAATSATTSQVVPSPGDIPTIVTLVGEDDPARALVPTGDIGDAWRGGAAFDDSSWLSGPSGVGYENDNGGSYDDFFGIDVLDLMLNQRDSVYLRIPFQVEALANIVGLNLRMRYDDGFAAFLNGDQVASSNAPASLTWAAAATGNHDDNLALVFEDFELLGSLGSLQEGANILAIQGLNDSPSSSDLLAEPLLQAGVSSGDGSGQGFWRVIVTNP